jgi:hypothetical protein
MSKTLSQETIVSNADFVLWSLHNTSLEHSAPVLLNKRTHQTCGQPHGPRFVCRLGISMFPLGIKLIVTSANCLHGSVFNDCGLYHRVWVESALNNQRQSWPFKEGAGPVYGPKNITKKLKNLLCTVSKVD